MPKLTPAQRQHLSKKLAGLPEKAPAATKKRPPAKAHKLYPGMAVASDPAQMGSLSRMGSC
jgi:hypothetical protein